ncbi:hypothetical protein RHGRI_029946 [Rhododendron griersonianum]|uniref:Uncharacterized protein n=1 Tax=Rhododendron griersonianum TaxID=479676 RepID=A0AAV6IQP0_9ERIC|nr:hypothetical protein RHGRI_029946 [Rhododendron griersonianum]
MQGATRQVRFQPRLGKLLVDASGNRIGLFDVETNILQCYLVGHVKEVRSICWDSSGRYIASVSEESARVWAFASGGYELQSNRDDGGLFFVQMHNFAFHRFQKWIGYFGSCSTGNKAVAEHAHFLCSLDR